MESASALQTSDPAVCMSQERYAALVGVSKDTVRGWLEQGTIPSVKVGKQRFVNVRKVIAELDDGKTIFTRGDYEG